MTAQLREVLIYEGQQTSMATTPPLPEANARITPLEPVKADSENTSTILFSTACWRRYQGTWEIKDGRLYLTRLRGIYQLQGSEPLPADWYSGVLRVPRGELLKYVHMGFESVYEEDLLIFISNGRVTGARVINNRGRQNEDPSAPPPELPGARA
jgi:hypothetical protein